MNNPLLQVHQLTKHYKQHAAVDNVSFAIEERKTLGLVGESGSGKSTTAKMILRLVEPSQGSILFKGEELLSLGPKQMKEMREQIQMVFQDPYSSLNPRMTVLEIIAEPLTIHQRCSRKERKERVEQLLFEVGLDASFLGRFPHELSGGQRQRIGIARALALNPRLLLCDEPISALDVSVQAQIINLLKKLQREKGLTYLFISHDLRVVKYMSDEIAVMYLGNIVEMAPADTLYKNPLHPYTQELLSLVPSQTADTTARCTKGCPFAPRCPKAKAECREIRPQLQEIIPNHKVACHLFPSRTTE